MHGQAQDFLRQLFRHGQAAGRDRIAAIGRLGMDRLQIMDGGRNIFGLQRGGALEQQDEQGGDALLGAAAPDRQQGVVDQRFLVRGEPGDVDLAWIASMTKFAELDYQRPDQ